MIRAFLSIFASFTFLLGGVSLPTDLALAVPAKGHQIMVAGPSPDSVEIARHIHRKGGNVVDVAVAVALGLSVTHPYYAALGGGGFAMVRMGKTIKALDFREIAPKSAHPELYKNLEANASRLGGLAVGVPGVVAGLHELHKTHGKLKWSALFEDAVRLAEKGFSVSGEWVDLTTSSKTSFNQSGRQLFFKKDQVPLKPGEVLRQPGLAKLLRQLSQKGPDAFYKGAVAREIVETVNASGGKFTTEDLASYKIRWLDPLVAELAGHKLFLMPPPSSGGIVIAQAVRLMEKTRKAREPLSVEELHWLIEIQKLSYRGRSLLGDPSFAKNPIEQLLSDAYLDPMAALIKPDKAIDITPLKSVGFEPAPQESGNTTHFSVMDANGNSVAFTVTLNGNYGSGLVTPKSGIALNNEMDDFTTKPGQPNMFGLIQGAANSVQAGARPLSSMSPTIIEKEGRTVLSLGSPGGPRIISAVLQVLYRSITQSFDIDQAIQAPRVHHQFMPDVVNIDALKLSPDVIQSLQTRGHQFKTSSTAKVYAIRLNADGILEGAFDSRGEGAAGGL